jgi:hypothetical protein
MNEAGEALTSFNAAKIGIGDVNAAFRCSICQDIYQNPSKIGCQHCFCHKCITLAVKHSPHCPICRVVSTTATKDIDMERRMASTKTTCRCGEDFWVSEIREHSEVCQSARDHELDTTKTDLFRPHRERRPGTAESNTNSPNRVTFQCPLCEKGSNLDCKGLLEHIESDHPGQTAAQCPVCLAMPWSDPSYVCQDFQGHCRRRHRFEYESFVDFESIELATVFSAMDAGISDEDAMLQAALAASMAA